MNKEFQDCLSSKRIREFLKAKELVSKELDQAESDYHYAEEVSSATSTSGARFSHTTRCFILAEPYFMRRVTGKEATTV